MEPSKARLIQSLGGRRAHESGNAYAFTTEAARAAGKLGGAAVSKNREHMAAIGRRGGGVARSCVRDDCPYRRATGRLYCKRHLPENEAVESLRPPVAASLAATEQQ